MRKIIKELKNKTSSGHDEISSEILKMGADVGWILPTAAQEFVFSLFVLETKVGAR